MTKHPSADFLPVSPTIFIGQFTRTRMRLALRLLFSFIFLLTFSPTIFAADVYVLKSIDVPQVYANSPIVAEFTIENKNPAANSTILHVTIRNDQGQIIQGFNDYQVNLSFNSNPIKIVTVPIPLASINEGETYTIDSKIDWYDPPFTQNDETTKGNNSARKTFTLLKAPQTYQVPDMPLELSFVSMLLVLSGLLYFGRVQKRN